MWYSAAFIPIERGLLLCDLLYLSAAESFICNLFNSIPQNDDEMHMPQLKKSDMWVNMYHVTSFLGLLASKHIFNASVCE